MIAAMPAIHPTAIVDPSAELAEDTTVGAGCIVEAGVRLGRGTRLSHRVTLEGPLVVGEDNVFYPNVCVGLPPQDLNFDPSYGGAGVSIGDRNLFREGVTLHRATGATPTTVGDDNFFMVNTHAGHDAYVGNGCTLTNGALLAGHVELHDGVTLGGNAAVQQFSRLGRLAMVAGLAPVVKDLPPFFLVHRSGHVGSLNLVGLRRAGYRTHVGPLREAFDLLYRRGLPLARAADEIERRHGDDPLCAEVATFVRAAHRGITPYARRQG